MTRAVLLGVGSALPARVVSNDELAEKIDTSDEWIRERTGIRQRYIADESETTVSLGTEAARKALDDAGLDAGDIDLIVLATATPNNTFPASAALIQRELGIRNGAAFDVQAVCSGFLYALSLTASLLETGQHKRALVIGAETFSRILDWEDRRTCVLFGDGAGAFVLEAQETDDRGVLASVMRCDGSLSDILYVDGGPSSTQTTGYLRMDGPKVFKEAVSRISGAIVECAEGAGVAIPDIDWFVPHQANQRILVGVAKKLKLDESRVISTVAEHANTSAASIPLAFDRAWRDGRIGRGELCMLEGMGGGLTWGAVLLRT
ncbi:beta-ketoacyl-ACP synthase III [Parvularcula lutaonensis]|uniref:Beta-ketoacyl-[acyl-carrier-protein] synthase III n=1 Tax=Parvularcula lutaonensis TaxID=491923 RepID=A0ABV7MBT2_9PROT|nr:beta-ketoacyl-ACP synthase III [Parvularcula lutaonensis]GGY49014.1 3-oxoacyl-[acyl-carrier-protein] synthase 3 [Parvularcula lutaonensis]